jgi:hypothetical protein
MRTRRLRLQWRLQRSSPAAHRERSRRPHPHLNLPRQKPRHPRQVNRDRERRAVVAAAEVVAEVVRGREQLRPRSQNLPQ